MKQFKLTLFAFAVILFGCQEAEFLDPGDTGAVAMKTVTLSAGMDNYDTKASLDSQTGAFTWQSGDLVSVLATDGKFYDFILTEGKDTREAVFEGTIPETAQITTVATYPRIVANGSDNTVLSENTLNYVLPATWTHATDVSNVPMVATFGEGAEHMSFKQVGGVMRFPVKNLPPEAQFVVTMADKTITGSFPVDITKLGEEAMVAGAEASVLTINYSSDVDGAYAEFNVPVPTGTYNNFKVEIKDSEGNVLLTKNYSKNNTVNRATLLNMQELVLPDRPMVISEVWPFFVDARAVFSKHEGISKYAVYVDDATDPEFVDAEVFGDKVGVLFGGNFAHASTHKVAVAKVVDGTPVVESKSEAVEFKTADMRQLTTNTGTKFVSVGWDDVAIGSGPKWDDVNKRWSLVPWTAVPEDGSGLKVQQRRGYQVQLLAADQTTVIYDMIPFDGHASFYNPFSDSSWLGKVGNEKVLIPTALTFGYLEPGKDYYFRVKTLDRPVVFNETNGNYAPGPEYEEPYPYTLISERGGCEWSELIKLSTDPAHVASENEILHEGFDDIMVANDYMNWAPAVVPDLEQKPIDWGTYRDVNMKTTFPAFLAKPASERKWTVQAFAESIRADYLGLMDNAIVANVENKLNSLAGSLEGWSSLGTSVKRTVYPIFGAMRIGQSGSNKNGAVMYTPSVQSDKLRNDVRTKCIVTLRVAYCANAATTDDLILKIHHVDNNQILSSPTTYNIAEMYPSVWAENMGGSATESDYAYYQQYYVVEHEVYLKNGDRLGFEKPSGRLGFLVIGDISISMVPGEYEGGITNPDDMGLGTEPDDTDYDIFNMNEFPISYYHGAPTSAYTKTDPDTGLPYYDYDATKQIFQDIKDAGINVVTYTGACDYSIEENKRLLGICEELGLKFFSAYQGGHSYSMDWITAVKENLYSSDAYLGDFIRDEPNASEFESMGTYVKEFLNQMPDKEVYVNLFPEYASATQLGTNTYEEHINQYLSKVPTKMLGFDYYGVKDWGLDTRFYSNYDIVRTKSLAKRMPYLAITAAGGIGSSQKDPSETELRWQVWASIAMGSKGISYFTYWTPDGDPALVNNEYMIRRDGTKRDMYYWVKDVNADIKTIGKKLINCHADGAIISYGVTYPLYYNNGISRTNYGPIKKVRGSDHYLCGCFRDARISEKGENYKGYKALVTNQFPQGGDNSINLTLDLSVAEVTFTHNNTTKTLSLSNNLNESIDTDVTVSYTGGVLTLNIPAGEAVLLEF